MSVYVTWVDQKHGQNCALFRFYLPLLVAGVMPRANEVDSGSYRQLSGKDKSREKMRIEERASARAE